MKTHKKNFIKSINYYFNKKDLSCISALRSMFSKSKNYLLSGSLSPDKYKKPSERRQNNLTD